MKVQLDAFCCNNEKLSFQNRCASARTLFLSLKAPNNASRSQSLDSKDSRFSLKILLELRLWNPWYVSTNQFLSGHLSWISPRFWCTISGTTPSKPNIKTFNCVSQVRIHSVLNIVFRFASLCLDSLHCVVCHKFFLSLATKTNAVLSLRHRQSPV